MLSELASPNLSALTVRRPIVVESVDAHVGDSLSHKIHLIVSGYQTDGSGVPVRVEQQRDGRWLFVHIYREWDVDAVCPAVTAPFYAAIPLEAEVDSGPYTVVVNNYLVELAF